MEENVRELRFGIATEPQTLDPLSLANTADGRSILFNVFEGLVKSDSSGTMIPAVAESFRIEENGLVYVFRLRQGILFNDGSAIRPQDVVFSYNTALEARLGSIANISTVELNAANEIVITLIEADPEFLPFLTLGIASESNPDREAIHIGSGPYMIESYSPQEELRLVKNPHYWQAGIPKIERVTIVFISNSASYIPGLIGGNIDGAILTGSTITQLDFNNFDVTPWASNMVHLMGLNNAIPPFNDIRVRQAVNYALDIQGIIDTAFFGTGEPSGSPLIPSLRHVYDASLKDPFPRDLAKARSLLEEAGLSQGFSFEIAVPSNYSMHVDTAQVMVNQLAEAGINVSIRLFDWGTWLTDIYRARNYEATIISLDGQNVSPRSFLARYQSNNNGNFINFSSSEYDMLYREVLTEADEERRISIYMELQNIVSGNAASVFIQDITGLWVFRRGLVGGVLNYPISLYDFAAMYWM